MPQGFLQDFTIIMIIINNNNYQIQAVLVSECECGEKNHGPIGLQLVKTSRNLQKRKESAIKIHLNELEAFRQHCYSDTFKSSEDD